MPRARVAILLCLVSCQSCTSDGDAISDIGASGGIDGGEIASGGAPSGAGGLANDAGFGAATSGSTSGDAGDAGTDAQDAAAPRQPADPCGEDLLAAVGRATPTFGAASHLPTFSGDPNESGSFAVHRTEVTIDNPDASRPVLPGTFYAPSADGGVSVAPGQFALVLLLHGFGTTHNSYEHFSLHLASHGLVVLGVSLPFALTAAHDKNAAEAIAAIDFALGSAAPAALVDHIDAEKVAVAGHSMGGKIAFYAAAQDPRIDLVIGWDPSNAGGPPCFVDPAACNKFPVAPSCGAMDSGLVHLVNAETLVLRAAPDGANPEAAHNAIHFFRGSPAPATLVDYDANVLHGDFASAFAAVIPRARRIHLSFLLDRFYGQDGLAAWLPGGAQIADGAVRVLSKP